MPVFFSLMPAVNRTIALLVAATLLAATPALAQDETPGDPDSVIETAPPGASNALAVA